MYRIPEPTTTEHILFCSFHETYTKIEHILAIKNTFTNQKNRNHTAFLDHSGIRLQINNRNIAKSPNIWKINNTYVN